MQKIYCAIDGRRADRLYDLSFLFTKYNKFSGITGFLTLEKIQVNTQFKSKDLFNNGYAITL